MSIVLVATVTPLPEKRDAVRLAFCDVIPDVQAELGCQLYALHETKAGFVVIEQWRDGEALKAHGQSPAMSRLTAALDGRLADAFDVQMLRPIPCGSTQLGQLV